MKCIMCIVFLNDRKFIVCLFIVILLDVFFFVYFLVWFGVSRDVRFVEVFFNFNICIIWNVLIEFKVLIFIFVF